MPTIKIVSRHDSNKILFECEVTEDQEASGTAIRHAMERATAARANLSGANLSNAYLSNAYLSGAYLSNANLSGANLSNANLSNAYLSGANLSNANLSGANLSNAYLSNANLSNAYLSGAKVNGLAVVGDRPFMQVGPIGSRCAQLVQWLTAAGPRIQTGCFLGTRAEFEAAIADTHGDNEQAEEYRAALVLLDAHAKFWTPKEVA